MDPVKMAVHGVTPLDVQQALGQQNVDLPSGRIEGSAVEISLRTDGRLKALDQPLSAIRHGRGDYLAIREEARDRLSCDPADLKAGERTLEGVGDHNAFFHALTD